jgi:hypothetical protein
LAFSYVLRQNIAEVVEGLHQEKVVIGEGSLLLALDGHI